MDITTILNAFGEQESEDYLSTVPAIIQSGNFAFRNTDALRAGFEDFYHHAVYTRGNNPTVAILRRKMAALEKAEDALIFGSGSAAIAASVLSCVKAGDHIISVGDPYSWTAHLFDKFLQRFGVQTDYVDGRQLEAFKKAIRPNTQLIYLESPNTMTFELQDLHAVATLAKAHHIKTICDNSYATPLNQNPIAMGIDMVVHSASKYIGGHSDVIAGILCGSEADMRRVFEGEFMTLGAVISPNDAWLLIRGLRTLSLRVQKSSENAQQLIRFLAEHPRILKVFHPFSPDNPQLELAKSQMSYCGGLFSILLSAESVAEVDAFVNRLKHFVLAASWGAYEALVLPNSIFYSTDGSGEHNRPYNLIRFYAGTGNPNILIEDLKMALSG